MAEDRTRPVSFVPGITFVVKMGHRLDARSTHVCNQGLRLDTSTSQPAMTRQVGRLVTVMVPD